MLVKNIPKQVMIRRNDEIILNVAYDRIEQSVVGNVEEVIPEVLADLFDELIENGPYGLEISFRQRDAFVKEKKNAQEKSEGQQGTQKVDEREEEGKEYNQGSETVAGEGPDDGAGDKSA